MNWKLSDAIMARMPQWQRQNHYHVLARHLLELPNPPQEEAACYQWLGQQVELAEPHGLDQLPIQRVLLEALHRANASLTQPEPMAIIEAKGLTAGKGKLLLRWAQEQQQQQETATATEAEHGM